MAYDTVYDKFSCDFVDVEVQSEVPGNVTMDGSISTCIPDTAGWLVSPLPIIYSVTQKLTLEEFIVVDVETLGRTGCDALVFAPHPSVWDGTAQCFHMTRCELIGPPMSYDRCIFACYCPVESCDLYINDFTDNSMDLWKLCEVNIF